MIGTAKSHPRGIEKSAGSQKAGQEPKAKSQGLSRKKRELGITENNFWVGQALQEAGWGANS
jgi:hypothetical protein